MDEKDLGELRELVEFLKQNGIAQFEMERADLKVKLKFAGAEAAPAASGLDFSQLAQLMNAGASAVPALAPLQPSSSVAGTVAAAETTSPSLQAAAPEADLHIVKSPLVGTFYASPSPGGEPFVKVGDRVSSGQVLCIVEAMKLMNEVEADAAGEIVKVFPASGQPIEYGQHLFAIR